ncbi:MAG: EamA family transporter [Clostridiales bacterium]|nr:EamA family transporter [Clostridiales bacterium]
MSQKISARYLGMGVAFTLAGGICWGFSGACGQFLMQQRQVDAGWLVSFRMLVAGVMMLLFSAARARSLNPVTAMWKKPKDALHTVVFGILGMAMCQLTYFVTIGLSNAGTATVLEYLSPVMIMMYVAIRKRKFPGPVKIAVLILALLGTALLATHGQWGTLALSKEALIWGIASAVAFALNSLLPEKLMHAYGTIPIVGWGMVIGGLFLSVPYRVWQPQGVFDGAAILCMLGIVVIGTFISYTGYMEGLRRIGPEKANLYACIEPVSATAFAVLWLKSNVQLMDFVGIGCILAAVTLLSLKEKTAE